MSRAPRPVVFAVAGAVALAFAGASTYACRGNVPEEPPRTPPNSPIPELDGTKDPGTSATADGGAGGTTSTTPDAVREPKK
jgi:hypothetical protein